MVCEKKWTIHDEALIFTGLNMAHKFLYMLKKNYALKKCVLTQCLSCNLQDISENANIEKQHYLYFLKEKLKIYFETGCFSALSIRAPFSSIFESCN